MATSTSITPQKVYRIGQGKDTYDAEKTQYFTTPGSRSRQSTHAVYVWMTSHQDQQQILHKIWKDSIGKFGLRMDSVDFSGEWSRDSREIYDKFTTLFNEIHRQLPPSPGNPNPIATYVGSTERTIPARSKEHAGPKHSVWKTFLTHHPNHRAECHNLLENIPPEHVVHFEGFIQRVVVAALQGLTYDPSDFAKWVDEVDPSGKEITAFRKENPTGLYNPRRVQFLNAKMEPTFDGGSAGDAFAKAMERTARERIDRRFTGTKRGLATTLEDLSQDPTPVTPLGSISPTGSSSGSTSPILSDLSRAPTPISPLGSISPTGSSQDSSSRGPLFQSSILSYVTSAKKRRTGDH